MRPKCIINPQDKTLVVEHNIVKKVNSHILFDMPKEYLSVSLDSMGLYSQMDAFLQDIPKTNFSHVKNMYNASMAFYSTLAV